MKLRIITNPWASMFLYDETMDGTVEISAGDEDGGRIFLRDAGG